MDKKEVIWSIRAKEEFQHILDFYINRNGSPNYSLQLLTETEAIVKLLETQHFLGRRTDNSSTRVFVNHTFLIFYEIGEVYLEIVSYWDNRQDPEKRVDHE